MNPSVNVGLDERQPNLHRDDDKPQQKLNSALKTNVKSLKQGFRSVMNGRGLGKVGPRGKEKQTNKATTTDEVDNTETDDINPEEPPEAFLPPADNEDNDNQKEDEAEINCGSGHSQKNPRGKRDLAWQGSQSGSQELSLSPLQTTFNEGAPLSPCRATSMNIALNYPNSAPQYLGVSPGPSAQTNKNNKFLKIKISKLKNLVGGLDLGGSSSNNHLPRAGDDEVEDDHVRRRQDAVIDDEFASPQPMVGPGRKMAKKMRNSIFKNLGKVNKNANANAPVLLGDPSGSMVFDFKPNAEDDPTEDLVDVGVFDSDSNTAEPPDLRAISPVPPPPPVIEQEIDHGIAAHGFITSQEPEEAKQKRKEKHHHRRRQLDAESDHSPSATSDKPTNSESISPSVSGPPLQRKRTTKGKLDPQARERLKKHSEGRDFRHQDRTTNRRRRQTLARKVSERKLLVDSSDTGMSDVPDLVPASFKDFDKAPFARGSSDPQHSSSRRPTMEPQSGRKLNREEDEKLRGRVRARQSFLANKEEDYDDDDDSSSFADDIQSVNDGPAEPVSPVVEDEASLIEDIHEKEKQDKSSALPDVGSASPLKPSSGHGAESGTEGSFQSVNSSHKSDNYLQLVISNVPAKTASPAPLIEDIAQGQDAAAPDRTSSPRREKRLLRKSSRRSVTDRSMESSELRRTKTGSSRARGEKRGDPSSRRRRSRGEKAGRPRDRSARRKSDAAARRRKTKSDTSPASDPVLSAVITSADNDCSSTIVDNASELFEHQSVNLETSSRNPLDRSTSTLDVSSKMNEVQEVVDSVADLDISAQGESGKEPRRRHHKERRAERKSSSRSTSNNGVSRQSIATTSTSTSSSKQPKLNRSNSRVEMSGALRRTPSGRQGGTEKHGRRGTTEQRTRRHSTDARQVPGSDSKSVKPPSEAAKAGLVQIKW